MKKFVQLALLALIVTGAAAAQKGPAVDVFGGYSYLNLRVPESGVTTAQNFKLNGFDASATIGLFRHFSAEADISGHELGDCGGITGLGAPKCSDFSYMFGPRYTFGDHSSRITAFVHGLVGRDQANLLGLNSLTFNDTATAVAGGAGLDYWFARHVGVQLGPIDVLYTNHLNADGASSQTTYRVAVGVAFRFGGNIPPAQPTTTANKQPAEAKPKTHRSWIRPWHKTVEAPAEGEETTTATNAPPTAAPPARVASVPSRGMAIHSLGVVVAPQEFDGARVLEIEPGSVAEMASLHIGDLIKSVDGKVVRTPMELAAELSEKAGKTRIGIQRGSFVTETTVLLAPH